MIMDAQLLAIREKVRKARDLCIYMPFEENDAAAQTRRIERVHALLSDLITEQGWDIPLNQMEAMIEGLRGVNSSPRPEGV